jgi:hypothetical protein
MEAVSSRRPRQAHLAAFDLHGMRVAVPEAKRTRGVDKWAIPAQPKAVAGSCFRPAATPGGDALRVELAVSLSAVLESAYEGFGSVELDCRFFPRRLRTR